MHIGRMIWHVISLQIHLQILGIPIKISTGDYSLIRRDEWAFITNSYIKATHRPLHEHCIVFSGVQGRRDCFSCSVHNLHTSNKVNIDMHSLYPHPSD